MRLYRIEYHSIERIPVFWVPADSAEEAFSLAAKVTALRMKPNINDVRELGRPVTGIGRLVVAESAAASELHPPGSAAPSSG